MLQQCIEIIKCNTKEIIVNNRYNVYLYDYPTLFNEIDIDLKLGKVLLKSKTPEIIVKNFVEKQSALTIYEAFRLNSPSAARERQIMLFSSRVYDINMHLKKLCDKRFRRIFSSAFQWCRWFFRNFPFSPSKSIKHTISRKVYF